MGKKTWCGILVVGSGAKIVMDYLGYLDFIVQRYHDPNWLGVAYNYVMSFSPPVNLLIFLIALSLFSYSLKSKNKDAVIHEKDTGESKPKENDDIEVNFAGIPQTQIEPLASAADYVLGVPTTVTYSFVIHAKKTINNMGVQLESVATFPYEGEQEINLLIHGSHTLELENGQPSINLPSGRKTTVQFLYFSYRQKDNTVTDFKMHTPGGQVFDLDGKRYKLAFAITGESIEPKTVDFSAEGDRYSYHKTKVVRLDS